MKPFEQIGHDYIGRNFNDRRPGSQFKGQTPPYGGNYRPGTGGSSVPRKPKPPLGPKNPFTIALKAGAHKQG